MYNKEIHSIVVVYKPDFFHLEKLVYELLNQTNYVYLCNNSDKDIEFNIERVEVLNMKRNFGIAKAQSIGMKKAFSNHADFVIQFDQDSFPEKNMVDKLLASFYTLSNIGYRIGVIAPQDYNSITSEASKSIKGNKIETPGFDLNCCLVDTVISSGCIISKEAYSLVGEMKDELFIDLVDHEYCWRTKYNNLEVVKDFNCKLYHRVGNGTINLTPLLSICNCAPFRHYYSYRNAIYLYGFSYVPLKWKLKSIIKNIFLFVVIVFFMDQKKQRIKYSVKGVFHGIKKKMDYWVNSV